MFFFRYSGCKENVWKKYWQLSIFLVFLNCSCSLPKDLYYDQDASDKDKKDEEAAKKKANRPSEYSYTRPSYCLGRKQNG